MEPANSTRFENIAREMCRKEELRGTAYRLNDVPEALQEVRSTSGAAVVENAMEKLKAGKNNVREKQGHDLDRLVLKRKSESNDKPGVRKEQRLMEPENQALPVLLPHIPLKSLMEVEMKLVYTDEEDVTYEFLAAQVAPTNTQAKCTGSANVDSPRLPGTSRQPQMDKWLQVSLKDASTCYRQKKYAVAAGQFRTALEVGRGPEGSWVR